MHAILKVENFYKSHLLRLNVRRVIFSILGKLGLSDIDMHEFINVDLILNLRGNILRLYLHLLTWENFTY